jgi:hypothetical protein
MDQAIGKILKSLETKGVLDDTLVVFFNDNGGVKENPPFRGHKGHTFEGGVRVPCLLRWPGRIPANQRVDGMMHVVDLYPTLIRQAGASLEQDLPLDGMDMWDTITGNTESPRTEVVYSLPGGRGNTGTMAIRRGNFKLVGPALFNVKEDPFETKDLAETHPEIYQSLHERLRELTKERRTPEIHTHITEIIDQPLLVFGKEENAHPPSWLSPYLKALPSAKRERKESAGSKRGTPTESAPKKRPPKVGNSSAELFEKRDLDHNDQVTLEEYLNGRTGSTVKNLEQRFKERDKNGDGTWSKDEI